MAFTDVPAFTAVNQPAATFNTYLRDNLLAMGEYQRCRWIDPSVEYSVQSGFTLLTDVAPPVDPYGYGMHNTAQNSYMEFEEYLTAGTWTMNIHTAKRSDYGTVTASVEGVAVGTFNNYTNNAVAQFQLNSAISFDVDTPGIKTLRFEAIDKDINSSGYTVRLFAIGLQKTADANPAGIWTTPRTWAANEYVSSANLETHLRDNLRASGPFPGSSYIDAFSWSATSGGTLAYSATTALAFHTLLDTQNEWVEWPLVLPAGQVTISIIGTANTDAGIATVKWDGSDRGTIDFYAASLNTNARPTGVTFTNTVPKKATLRITNATKNASSSAYNVKIHRIYVIFDNSTWTDPKHLPARMLTTVADLNTNTWRAHMRMRAEMPWVIDIDPLTTPAVDNNEWSNYAMNVAWYYFCGLSTNSGQLPGYEGFWVEWDVALAAGTYECTLVGGRGTDAGQMDVLLDSTAIVSNAEFYNAAIDRAVRTTTGIVVATTKTYRVRVQINSKNASSTQYFGVLNRLRFLRTA